MVWESLVRNQIQSRSEVIDIFLGYKPITIFLTTLLFTKTIKLQNNEVRLSILENNEHEY